MGKSTYLELPRCQLIPSTVLLTSPVCGKNNKPAVQAATGSWTPGARGGLPQSWALCCLQFFHMRGQTHLAPWPLLFSSSSSPASWHPSPWPCPQKAWPERSQWQQLPSPGPGPACRAQAVLGRRGGGWNTAERRVFRELISVGCFWETWKSGLVLSSAEGRCPAVRKYRVRCSWGVRPRVNGHPAGVRPEWAGGGRGGPGPVGTAPRRHSLRSDLRPTPAEARVPAVHLCICSVQKCIFRCFPLFFPQKI